MDKVRKPGGKMDYIFTKQFKKFEAKLFNQGGINKNVVDEFHSMLGKHSGGFEDDPIAKYLRRTKNKETRLKDCEKFVLRESYRLITQKQSNKRTMCFIGNHDTSEKFLNQSRKQELFIDEDQQLNSVTVTENINNYQNVFDSDLIELPLVDRFPTKEDLNYVLSDIPTNVALTISKFDHTTSDDEILQTILEINNDRKQIFILDVLTELRVGDKNAVKNRILVEKGELRPLGNEEELISVKSGDEVIVLEVGSKEYSNWIKSYFENANYYDWMLFTHPKQQEIVEEDFSGPTLLNGVSGSGKTCIIIKRAIRHAMKKPKKSILILTLNRSLTHLILKLIDNACPKEVRGYIDVISFFELCQDFLDIYETSDVRKLYDDVTWKLDEHIDEVWREYYRCWTNNDDAKVLFEIHKHFNSREIIGEKYLKDEFDWIRSRFSKKERNLYLNVERSGRVYPILKEWRESILKGLEGWELKMSDVGIIDYLGLSSKLMDHFDEMKDEFSHILVDEVQDFGHIELKIIRKLTKEGQNDIFMAGDEIQKASAKFRSFNMSGLKLLQGRIRNIKKNYRNSREILEAAFSIFNNNYNSLIDNNEEFEILEPEFANFSFPQPWLINGESFSNEISSTLTYLRVMLESDAKKRACISIVGYTLRELKDFCNRYNLTLLDGSKKYTESFEETNLFVSDLEQMKGFEFDYVIILNCSEGLIPNPHFTEEENLTYLKLFYIAMTRAKEFLGISYSGKYSEWIENSSELFKHTTWTEECAGMTCEDYEVPKKLHQIKEQYPHGTELLTGSQFLYTEKAIGVSLNLQNRIEEHINGENISRDGKLIKWANIESAKKDLRIGNMPGRQMFGSQDGGWKEFIELFELHP